MPGQWHTSIDLCLVSLSAFALEMHGPRGTPLGGGAGGAAARQPLPPQRVPASTRQSASRRFITVALCAVAIAVAVAQRAHVLAAWAAVQALLPVFLGGAPEQTHLWCASASHSRAPDAHARAIQQDDYFPHTYSRIKPWKKPTSWWKWLRAYAFESSMHDAGLSAFDDKDMSAASAEHAAFEETLTFGEDLGDSTFGDRGQKFTRCATSAFAGTYSCSQSRIVGEGGIVGSPPFALAVPCPSASSTHSCIRSLWSPQLWPFLRRR